MIALRGFASGLPNATDGASSKADDPGTRHQAKRFKHLLTKNRRQRGEQDQQAGNTPFHQRTSVSGDFLRFLPLPKVYSPTRRFAADRKIKCKRLVRASGFDGFPCPKM